ncbi:MAG TPA: hypothetical protein VES97_10215 [Solirubrobacteraceae bacterium]|nr:hypothetical protein [Solirubrobacteraceae bacterium]
MAESIEQLSYELTANALTEQERALAGLRMCAGTVLGAASIAGSFLGAKASRGSLDAWAVLALIAFALCFGCAIWVLLPHEFALAIGGEELLAVSDDHDIHDVTEAYRTAGSWLEPHLHANRRAVSRLSNWLSVSCTFLAVEVALWTISLAS